ncbi:MAG TPA: LysR substrate-binding domain-containing protein, partial [Burkholderiaceae bacterium]|nr:LysR substrate-binding domain-containing protein [Burkholderiaceae bacterium]
TASEVISVEVLPPLLAALRDAHPELVIELVPSNKVEDLLHREADIAVRMVRPSQDALVARRIGSIEVGLHAHRHYLDRHGTPRSLDDLAGHALVGWDAETAYIRKLQDKFPAIRRERFAFRADNDVAQLAAIRAGLGIGFCQARLAARDPALVRLFKSSLSLNLDTWIAMHADLRDSPRCAVTFAALADGLVAYARGG